MCLSVQVQDLPLCSCWGEEWAHPGIQRGQSREGRAAEGTHTIIHANITSTCIIQYMPFMTYNKVISLKGETIIVCVIGPGWPEGEDRGDSLCGWRRTCVDQRHQIPAIGEWSQQHVPNLSKLLLHAACKYGSLETWSAHFYPHTAAQIHSILSKPNRSIQGLSS